MRLWSIHPKYLDTTGLVALWRESLLAQKVLKGETKAYRNHPQLERFKKHPYPERAIADYLMGIWRESRRRGYDFNKAKIGKRGKVEKIQITRRQLRFEFNLLKEKLRRRDPRKYQELSLVSRIESHPLFEVIEGKIESWRKTKLLRF